MNPDDDLVIRGGSVIDGTGSPPMRADVAIRGDTIVAIRPAASGGGAELDATGCLVTPGFIDPHSHLDGNVTWESRLKPASGHGVTTTIMGNCGVGFAPCRPEHRRFTVALMEGVEDVPASVLDAGLPWQWESYVEYRSFLDRRSFDMNVTGLVPHSALRVFVMGERAIAGEPASGRDIEAMSALAEEAVRSGAVGVGSTRLVGQRTLDGTPAPSRDATEAELLGLARGLQRAGAGVIQIAPEFNEYPQAEHELAMMIRVAAESGRPLTFSLKQANRHPEGWRRLLAMASDANEAGVPVHPQVLGRPTGAIISWGCSIHPFVQSPSFQRLAGLPEEERAAELRSRQTRRAILEETPGAGPMQDRYRLLFRVGDTVDYEPDLASSVAAEAARSGRSGNEIVYDQMLADGGAGCLLLASGNYADGTLDPALEMMRFPSSILGLGDAGAHCTIICDASAPTYMLSYWTRDRTRGERLAVPEVVRKLTSEPASLFGLEGRGVLRAGMRADINVLRYDELALGRPRMEHDLPAGGGRLVQDARGYVATIVNGVVVSRDGADTGQRPGRLI